MHALQEGHRRQKMMVAQEGWCTKLGRRTEALGFPSGAQGEQKKTERKPGVRSMNWWHGASGGGAPTGLGHCVHGLRGHCLVMRPAAATVQAGSGWQAGSPPE